MNEAARLSELAKRRPERVLASEAALARADDERDRGLDGQRLRGAARAQRADRRGAPGGLAGQAATVAPAGVRR